MQNAYTATIPFSKHRRVDVPFAPGAGPMQQRFGKAIGKRKCKKRPRKKIHPSWHVPKTSLNSVMHFTAVFFDAQEIHHVQNPNFTTVKNTVIYDSTFSDFEKKMHEY